MSPFTEIMRISNRSYFLFLVLPYSIQAQDVNPATTLTFGEAIALMNRNNHLVKQTDYLVQQKQAEVRVRKSLYYPSVGLSGGYAAMQKDISLNLDPVRDAIAPLYNAMGHYGNFSGLPNPDPATNKQVPVLSDELSTSIVRKKLLEGLQTVQQANWRPVIQDQYFGSMLATARMPLFTGGKIKAANNAASIEEKEASEEMEVKKGELMVELAERYFGLKLAEQAQQVRKEVLAGMDRNLLDAKKMEEGGMLAHAEVLNAQVFQAQADREYKKAIRTTEILLEALANSLALNPGESIRPSTNLFYLTNLEPVEYFKQSALNNNPQLQQVRSKLALTVQGVHAEKAAWLPEIAIAGAYNIVNPSPFVPNWFAGVGAKWALFDGFARDNRVKAARLKTEQVKEAELKASGDISTMVDKLYKTLQMYSDQIAAINQSQVFAEEYLNARIKGFAAEMNSTTEVINARLGLSKVKIEKLEAMYGFDKTLAELLKISGMASQFESYKNSHIIIEENYQTLSNEK